MDAKRIDSLIGDVNAEACTTRVRHCCQVPILQGRAIADLISFEGLSDGREHVALKLGPDNSLEPLVRLHSECLTGDVFGSQRCDCGLQLKEAVERLAEEGGYLLYLRQEGRGIGLYAKIEAYVLQTAGLDTFEANKRLGFDDDERNYRCAAEMLRALGVSKVRLLTNNPDKVRQLVALGIDVVSTVPTGVYVNQHNREYLRAKAEKTSHTFRQ